MYLVKDYKGKYKGPRLEYLLDDSTDVESILGCLTCLLLIVDIVGSHNHTDKLGHRSGEDDEVDYVGGDHNVLRIA